MNGVVVVVVDTKLDVFKDPVLVGSAVVSPSTQLCTVVLVGILHVQHFVVVKAVQDLVAADAPVHAAVSRLILTRANTVACSATQPTSSICSPI